MNIFSIEELLNKKDPEFIISGLETGGLGLIVGANGIGKSHFALSLCLEIAHSRLTTVGCKLHNEPKKVLYISSEDSDVQIKVKIQKKMAKLGITASDISGYLDFACMIPPLFISNQHNAQMLHNHQLYLTEVTCLLVQYDLVIIDTLSGVLGAAHLVKDDNMIALCYRFLKDNIKTLYEQSDKINTKNTSIIFVHHVTKEHERSGEFTVASPSGISGLIREAKFILALSEDNEKKGLKYTYVKANYNNELKGQLNFLTWASDSVLLATKTQKKEPTSKKKNINKFKNKNIYINKCSTEPVEMVADYFD